MAENSAPLSVRTSPNMRWNALFPTAASSTSSAAATALDDLSGKSRHSCARQQRRWSVRTHCRSAARPITVSISQAASRSPSGSAENAEKERSGPCGVGAGAALLLGLYPTLRRRSMLDMPA